MSHSLCLCSIGRRIDRCGAAGLLVVQAPQVSPPSIGIVIGSEIFVSAGLVIVVLAASLVTGPMIGLLAVVAWLVMINMAAPGGPFANPVLALATPLALGSTEPSLVLAHVGAEFLGAALAVLIIAATYPAVASATAHQPHEAASVKHP
jgi:hypothetical protein